MDKSAFASLLVVFVFLGIVTPSSATARPQDADRQLFAVRLEGKWSVHRGDIAGGPAAGADPQLDVSKWSRVTLPEKGKPDFTERSSWYRTEFHWGQRHVPPAFLVLGRVDGEDAVYLNGLPVGGTAGDAARGPSGGRARIYRFEGAWLQPGRNVVAVRVDAIDATPGRIVGGPLRIASGTEALRTLGQTAMPPGLATAANFAISSQTDERGRLLARVVAEGASGGPLDLGWGNLSIADRDLGTQIAMEDFEHKEIDRRWPMTSFRLRDRRLGDLRIEGELFAPLAWRDEWICAVPTLMLDLRLENRGTFPREVELILRFHERLESVTTEISGFDEISSRLGYTGAQVGPLAIAMEGAVETTMPLPGFLKMSSVVSVGSGEVRRVRSVLAYREDSLRWSASDPGVERAVELCWSQWQQMRDHTVAFDRGMPWTGDKEFDAGLRAYGSYAARRTQYNRDGLAYIRTVARDPGAAAEEAYFTSSAHVVLWPVLEELMLSSWAGKILAELPTPEPPEFVLPHLWYAARAIRLARWKGAATRVTPEIARAFKRSVARVLQSASDGYGLPKAGPGEDLITIAALTLHVLEATTMASSSLRLDEAENAIVQQRLDKARAALLALPLPENPRSLRHRAYAWIFPSSATLEFLASSLAAVDAATTSCGIAESKATEEQGAITQPGLDYLDALGRARSGFLSQSIDLARRALRADLGVDMQRTPSRYLVGCLPESNGREGTRNATFLSFLTQGLLGYSRRDGVIEAAPWIEPDFPDVESNIVLPEGFIAWRRRARSGGWTLGFSAVLTYPLELNFLIRLDAEEGAPSLRTIPKAVPPPEEGEEAPAPPPPPTIIPPPRVLEVEERFGVRYARVPVRLETGHFTVFEIDRLR